MTDKSGTDGLTLEEQGEDLSVCSKAEPQFVKSVETTPQGLGRWFWGAIFFLAVVTLVLWVVAAIRAPDEPAEVSKQAASAKDAHDKVLTPLQKMAFDQASLTLERSVDQAYQPVIAAIPEYAEFHYSVWGSYVELGQAAIGDPTEKLEEMLFSGLDQRIEGAWKKSLQKFQKVLEDEIAERMEGAGFRAGAFDQLVDEVVSDAKLQIGKSAVLLASGALTGKAAAKVISKKLGAKIAVKAGAKGGSKWAAALTGAGGAGALCAWAGPGAGVCAAAGGVGAWFATDAVIGSLDEFFNRDEFEKELKILIEADKKARLSALEYALTQVASNTRKTIRWAVQDFSFKQLGEGRVTTCETARQLVADYRQFDTGLSARSPKEIKFFHRTLAQYAGTDALFALVAEIQENLANYGFAGIVRSVQLNGNFPDEFRVNRKVSARLTLGGTTIETEKVKATKDDGFTFELHNGFTLPNLSKVPVYLTIKQDLRIRSDRLFFSREREVDFFEYILEGRGLKRRFEIDVPLQTNSFPAGGNPDNPDFLTSNLKMDLVVMSKQLPELEAIPQGCIER